VVGVAEHGKVSADFHPDHSGGELIDTRQGLQELPVVGIGRPSVDQGGIQVRPFDLEVADMTLNLLQYPPMAGRKLPLQSVFRGVAFSPQSALGQFRQLRDGFSFTQTCDQGPCGNAVTSRHDGAEFDAGLIEQLVQAVLLTRPGLGLFLTVAGHQAQFPQVLGRNEAGSDQSEPPELGEPFRVGDVGLATGHVLDMTGVDPVGGYASLFQGGIDIVGSHCRYFPLPQVPHRAPKAKPPSRADRAESRPTNVGIW
jgi:hypothetical protein